MPRAGSHAAVRRQMDPLERRQHDAHKRMENLVFIQRVDWCGAYPITMSVRRLPCGMRHELATRAIHQTVRAIAVRLANPYVAVERLVRNLVRIVSAIRIGNDEPAWFNLGRGLFASMIALACEIDETIRAAVLDDGAVDGEEAVHAEWTARAREQIALFVDLVSQHLLVGVLCKCMKRRRAEACTQRMRWGSLFPAFEHTLATATAPEQHRYAQLKAHTLNAELVHTLQVAWDYPFHAIDFANERNAVAAQNVLGTPGRNAPATLPADVATLVASFLAPATVSAAELTRQQAVFASCADRHRAQTDALAHPEQEQMRLRKQASDERFAQMTHLHDTIDADALDARVVLEIADDERDRRVRKFTKRRLVAHRAFRLADGGEFDTSEGDDDDDDEGRALRRCQCGFQTFEADRARRLARGAAAAAAQVEQ